MMVWSSATKKMARKTAAMITVAFHLPGYSMSSEESVGSAALPSSRSATSIDFLASLSASLLEVFSSGVSVGEVELAASLTGTSPLGFLNMFLIFEGIRRAVSSCEAGDAT